MADLVFREPERGEECSLHPNCCIQVALSINRATYCSDTSRSRYPAPQSLEFRRVLSADSKHKRQPW